MNIGIMQSRLSPVDLQKGYQYWPQMWWDNEFKLAKLYGFNHIEWIYDENPNNLLNTEAGMKEIFTLSNKTQVGVRCICADYFIKHPFWDITQTTKNIKIMNMLIMHGFRLGVKNIVLPLIEESTMQGNQIMTSEDKQGEFLAAIKPCLDIAGQYMVNICLETDLKPYTELKSLIAAGGSPRLGICHDTGNVIEQGYDAVDSYSVYYPYVKHIHLKDKVTMERANVEIGTGNVDFTKLFTVMSGVKYDGTLTLQCARKEYDLEYIKKQFRTIRADYAGRNSEKPVYNQVP